MLPNPKTCKGSEETVIPSVRSEIFCTINEHPDVHWGRRGLPSFFLFRYQHLMSIILPRFRFSTSKPYPFLLLSFTSSCCGHMFVRLEQEFAMSFIFWSYSISYFENFLLLSNSGASSSKADAFWLLPFPRHGHGAATQWICVNSIIFFLLGILDFFSQSIEALIYRERKTVAIKT